MTDDWLAGAEAAAQSAIDRLEQPETETLLRVAEVQAQIDQARTLRAILGLIVNVDTGPEQEVTDGGSGD